ncbi:MAG TPA: hypothetical protein VF997_24280 [Polyangia bacterium]
MHRWLLLAALAAAGGCTVDTSAVPDAGACPANADYFVSDVWPRYLAANRCATRGCHDFDNGHGYLRLHVPEAAPPAGSTIDGWPIGWRENFLSALQLVDCDNPAASRILGVPEGQSNLHPPGPVVLDRQTAATVIQTWVGR